MAETSLDACKAKDSRFVADLLKSKGLQELLKAFKNHLYYLGHVRALSIRPCLHTHLPEHNRSWLKSFPGVGAFDQLEWTYNGAFEQLIGFGRREFEQKFSKNSNARGFPPGGGCLSFHLTGTLLLEKALLAGWQFDAFPEKMFCPVQVNA